MTTFGRKPILDVASSLGLDAAAVRPLGADKAKVMPAAADAPLRDDARLILVSAVTPTKAGEGKTTVSVGLADGLNRLEREVAVCLREPSLGPVFGIKGGGTGGGKAQVEPAADINLHFTGDLHAISAAHNLLSALIDNDLHFAARGREGTTGLAPNTVTWPRVVDVNDRALRSVVVSHGKRVERASRFDITAASEIMAVVSLASSLEDLRARLARLVVGWQGPGGANPGAAVTAADLGAVEAMVALLKDALLPNLVQTREGTPAFVHGGPFANIAHGCSSVVATRTALAHAREVVTEAGFGFDLGGEKFLDVKMRQAGLWPHLVVLVATVRALREHGGEGEGALERGLAHLDRQLANVAAFELPAVVAVNVFPDDTEADLAFVEAHCAARGVVVARVTAFTDGGAGGEALARQVLEVLDADTQQARAPHFLYPDDAPLRSKIETVASRIYGAGSVSFSEEASMTLERLEASGLGGLQVCMAKTHLSFSDDPKAGGLAEGFDLHVREVRLSAGAGFVVAVAGTIVTMPALPFEPAAVRMHVESDGTVRGLMQNEA